eukprot:Skav219437  [mRNA]  locus=scaffold1461:97486:99210:+ [translate_table: standard]
MDGPFTAPDCWNIRTVPAAHSPHTAVLKEGPKTHQPTSIAFAIEQIGSDNKSKVRRGEDWKRSHHNKTIATTDIPNAHRADTFIAIARWLHKHQHKAQLWASDHEAAYRQVAVRDPNETYVLLRIPGGWTLWRHHCLLFGSAASVWSYTRVADFITWLGRALTLAPMVHYVDDYACVEPPQTIDSSYQHTHSTLETIGFRFRTSKMQPPAPCHRIQGITMSITDDEFVLAPVEQRLLRIQQLINTTLLENNLTPAQAHKLAGKLQFLQEAIAGQGVRACIHPLWKLASTGTYTQKSSTLHPAVRDALQTLNILLSDAKPRRSPFRDTKVALVYADAFFKAGEEVIHLTEAADNWNWNPEASNLMENGWGFIIRLPDHKPVYSRGRIPGALLQHFTTRRAYIYALEVLSQALALVAGQNVLTSCTWFFCDNESGRCALVKGFGKEEKLNRLISCVWQLASSKDISPAFDRVTSKANMSDEISRNDLDMAEAMGWVRLDIDWETVYKILAGATRSLQASTAAAIKLKDLGWSRDDMVKIRDCMGSKGGFVEPGTNRPIEKAAARCARAVVAERSVV